MSGSDTRDEQLAVLAHELRNPLASLANAGEILAQLGSGDPAIQQVSEIVRRQTRVMRSLVEELLDLSRLDRERLALQRRRLDLRDVVRGSVEDHRAQMERKGLRCGLDLGSDAVPIDGDSVKLMQVLGNVLSNAIKFTPPPGTVHVAVETCGRCAAVTVRDSGAGIAPEMLDEIFGRFRQEHRGSHGGLGLGLPIAKGLVELHGGSIAAESGGPGTGCTIRIELPLAASGRAL